MRLGKYKKTSFYLAVKGQELCSAALLEEWLILSANLEVRDA